MQPSIFLPGLAAFVLLGVVIDRISKTSWSKSHAALYWTFCLTTSVAGFFLLARCNVKPDNFAVFYIELIGLAIGFRVSDKITSRSRARTESAALAEMVQSALRSAGALKISLDVTRFSAAVVENRIAALLKTGYKVTVVDERNEGKKTLQITTVKT